MRRIESTLRVCGALSRWVVAIALIAAGAPSLASGPPRPAEWERLAAMFEETLKNDRIVGGSIALVQDGRIVARRHYGFADKTKGRRVDDDTIFHWASITKTLNAITVMQLRDRGMLSLQDPLTRYVPELRRMHNPFGSMDDITIGMVLEHSAGFQGSTWPYRKYESWEPFEPTEWRQLVAMMPYQQIEFEPGGRFSYSNPSWIYVARALEDLTGDPWEYYVQKNIFTPLGMWRSYFGRTPPHLRENRSSRYAVRKEAGGEVVTEDLGGEFDPGITIPNGGWNGPLSDAAAYIGFLTGAGAGDPRVKHRHDSVLRRATLGEMWRPRRPVSLWGDAGEQIGLGFFLSESNGRQIVGHTGSQGGFLSFLYCDPSTGRGVIGALNTGNGAREEEAKSAFDILRSEALKVF